MAMVASLEPVSSSTISSTKPATEARQRSSRSASLRTIIERLSMGQMGTGLETGSSAPAQSVKPALTSVSPSPSPLPSLWRASA